MRSLPLAALAFLAACSPATDAPQPKPDRTTVAPVLDTPEAKDDSSYARPLEARVTHVALNLTADFAAKRLSGTATLDVQARPDAKEIVLDSKGLEIRAIADADGRALPWAVGASLPERGEPLTIQLGGARKIRIDYRSAPDADALQWLTPAQTASGKPFLFSQGQAILTRT